MLRFNTTNQEKTEQQEVFLIPEHTLSPLEKSIIKELKKIDLNEIELKKVLTNLKDTNPLKYKPQRISFPDKSVRFSVFSDAHMGHMDYRPDVLDKLIKDTKRQGCEFSINVGDTIEGMSGREGHIYELKYLGASKQMDYFKSEFEKFDKISKKFQVYSIEAQDSHSGWYHSKGNTGLNVGEELASRSKHYKFIGYDEQDLLLDNGLKIRLRHPGGGTAYAISYKMQKYVESISGGQKPDMVFQGHFHKAEYLFYRNIHCYDSGCLQNQSPFMKKKGTPAHLGYWIVDVKMNNRKKKLVERVSNQFIPFFE